VFPQGLAPLGIKLSGSRAKVWFLALHVPEPWQWPVIAVMILIGLAGFRGAYLLYRNEKSRLQTAGRGAGTDQLTSA
jgi:ABC-2 type transport system permease protein